MIHSIFTTQTISTALDLLQTETMIIAHAADIIINNIN